jgi:phospholipid transport system substrate-binding protein
MRMLWILIFACAVATGGAAAAPDTGSATPAPSAANNQDPSAVVQEAASGLLKDLESNRDAYRKDPKMLRQLTDKHLLPYFDTEFSARLVLGRHWRDATPDQRQRFVQAFINSLIDNYGAAVVEFTADRLKVFPSHVEPGAKSATVRTEIKRDDGTVVPVNYALHQTDQGWKAWDVVIEGISYVKSFRDDFGAEIDQKGIDEVIDRLQKGAKPPMPSTSGKKA